MRKLTAVEIIALALGILVVVLFALALVTHQWPGV